MNRITRNNYESFLLDLSEGNLSAESMEMVFDFFESNPDLAFQLDELETGPLLKTAYIVNKRKNTLVKDKQEDQLLDLIIAHTEGVATTNESAYLLSLAADSPSITSEVTGISLLKLVPETSEKFTRKTLFIHEVPMRSYAWIYRSLAAAAVVFLVWMLLPREITVNSIIAEQQPINPADASPLDDLEQPIEPSLKNNSTLQSPLVVASSNTRVEEVNLTEQTDVNIWVDLEEQPVRLTTAKISQVSTQKVKSKLQIPEENPMESTPYSDRNPAMLALQESERTMETGTQLGNKFSVIIDEKFTLAKEDQAIYLRVGRFTVSFVRSIFKRNTNEGQK